MVIAAVRKALDRFLRLDLLRHDVEERERQWFALCRLRHFLVFPWRQSDMTRAVMLLWLARGLSAHRLVELGALLVAWIVAGCLALRWLRNPAADHLRRLGCLQVFVVARAVVWAGALGLAISRAQSGAMTTLAIFGAVIMTYEVMCTIAIPVAGLIACAVLTVGIGAGIVMVPGMPVASVGLVMLVALGGSHYSLFNLHYLFATRRLRTRRLQEANETVAVLLAQYDEHGSDWLIEIDAAGRLRNATAKLCRALGRSREQLEGIEMARIFGNGPHVTAMRSAVQETGKVRDCLVPIRLMGRERWWTISGLLIYDSHNRVSGFRGFVRDVTEKHEADERIRFMANCDTLTGIANRGVFKTRLDAELVAACANGHPCAHRAVFFIDLDKFKEINDSHGHNVGDAVLIEVARRISEELGPRDFAGRMGGDEFAALLEVASFEEAKQRADRLAEILAVPIDAEGRRIASGASVGIAMFPAHAADADGLLRAADMALYCAKSAGRRCSMMFDAELERRLIDRRGIEADLRLALAQGELEVHYQPLHDIETRRAIGYEALLRWHHPQRGTISPVVFIPIAEESGLIVEIGEWVLREALNEAARWPAHLSIAVNVSPAQMRGDVLVRQVVNALAASGLAPGRLELEITETLLMSDGETHRKLLHQLRGIGVRIALDDFGTGYSSLSYLRSFPFDKLKMDRCFIHDLVDNPDSRALVTSMLDLARQFEMETIAEGVEDETQLALLRAMGCRQAQGFLFSRAIPARELPIARLTLPASNRRAIAFNAPMPARAGEPRAVRRGSV